MKKLLTATALVMMASTAQAVEYHKAVYEVPGKTAKQIETAANLKSNKVQITCGSWGANIDFEGLVTMEAKDGKYRLTFENFTADTGYQLAELPQNKKSCDKAIQALANDLHSKIVKWEDF